MVLATIGRSGQPDLATLLRRWIVAVDRCGLVLELDLLLGLGPVSLWPLASARPLWLGVESGLRLGAGLGRLAQLPDLLRMGSAASGVPVERQRGFLVGQRQHGGQHRIRHRHDRLVCHDLGSFLRSAPVPPSTAAPSSRAFRP